MSAFVAGHKKRYDSYKGIGTVYIGVHEHRVFGNRLESGREPSLKAVLERASSMCDGFFKLGCLSVNVFYSP